MLGIGGIFAIIKSRDAIDKALVIDIIETLRKYGKDGFGIAYLGRDSQLVISKALGDEDIISQLPKEPTGILMGICRYAVYGRPSVRNTPPFQDCERRFIVVARGALIEHPHIRSDLLKKGHIFLGKDIAEIIAHFVEDSSNSAGSIEGGIMRTFEELHGMYSAIIIDVYTFRTFLICRDLAEYIALSNNTVMLASEFDPIVDYARKILVLRNGVISIVDGEVRPLKDGELKEGSPRKGRVPGGFDYYMQREIEEIPYVLKFQKLAQIEKYIDMAKNLIVQAGRVYMIGSGSSYNAVLYGAYVINEVSDVVDPIPQNATEFIYFMLRKVRAGDVLIANSQSGKTSDVMRAVTESRMKGALIVGILNMLGSPLMYASNVYIQIYAGVENAIPATKTFIAQMSTFARLALRLAENGGYARVREILDELWKFARIVLDKSDIVVKKFAELVADKSNVFVLGRGINFPIALEGALKLKEVAQIHAEGVNAGEFRHGSKTLLSEDFPIVVIVPYDVEAREDTYSLLEEIGGIPKILIITGENDPFAKRFSRYVVEIPEVPEVLSPILNTLPLQKLAFYLGKIRNRPIDNPPLLSKAVVLQD